MMTSSTYPSLTLRMIYGSIPTTRAANWHSPPTTTIITPNQIRFIPTLFEILPGDFLHGDGHDQVLEGSEG